LREEASLNTRPTGDKIFHRSLLKKTLDDFFLYSILIEKAIGYVTLALVAATSRDKKMRPTTVRKTAPRVKLGKVQKKNLYRQSPNYYLTATTQLVIERQNPGKGFVHAVTEEDLRRFITLIPDWGGLSKGLNAIILARGTEDADGYQVSGVLHLCAVEKDMWREFSTDFFEDHRDIFERLGVPYREDQDGFTCFFDASTVRAYYLLHIFLHELGHHHDQMTSKNSTCGEDFAEGFARKYEALVWPRFKEFFGFPGKRN
jgi:hypothetical protein